LKVEYNQIQKYLGYAAANAEQDETNGGSEANYDSSTNYTLYPGTPETILTQAEIVGAMTSGNSDLTETAHGLTGTVDSKSYTWAKKL